jgi:hypothetical protein
VFTRINRFSIRAVIPTAPVRSLQGEFLVTQTNRYEDLKSQEDEGQFADPLNKTFPLATEADIHSSWRYINNPDNTAHYSTDEIEIIRSRIEQAARQHRIELDLAN